MVLDPKNRKGLSELDQKFLEIIDKYGWHVMSVAPRVNSDEKEQWWSYSTGLYFRYNHPEVVVFGLDSDVGLSIVNEAGRLIKAGTHFKTGVEYPEIFADRKCMFKAIDTTNYAEYFGFSIWFYESQSFPTLQIAWPDLDGHYPWHPKCNARVVELQPLLFKAD